MVIHNILTNRKIQKNHSWDLVYEWEDVFNSFLSVSYIYQTRNFIGKHWFYKHIINKFNFIRKGILRKKNTLVFEMSDKNCNIFTNKTKYIPIIIDCYPDNNTIDNLIANYSHNKIVFFTSRQVYDYLSDKKLPFPIEHLALSLPDKYRITPDILENKKYDCVIVGRCNKVLFEYLQRYASSHPTFTFISPKTVDNTFGYFSSSGEYIGDLKNREDYIKLLKQSRIGLYSTSGMDNDKLDWDKSYLNTNHFHQVTPRFLELLSCGCHVICRYERNSDTDYYELSYHWKNIENYCQFEMSIDMALTKEPDLDFYSNYLSKHYTSVRAQQLQNILEEYD